MRHFLLTTYYVLRTRHLQGFSLVEMVVYIGLLSIILVSLLSGVNLMLRSWREAQSRVTLAQSGTLVINRMVYDIRNATSIDTAGSTFAVASSTLKLSSTDSSGNATTTTYSSEGGVVKVAAGTGAAQSLLARGVGVSNFMLYRISTTNSEAVRIVLTLQAATTTSPVSATFYDTVVLRGSY